jgi:hypothetical protein
MMQASTTLKPFIMDQINQAVYDFMDKRMGIYVNRYKVEIILDEEDNISVSCHWPDEHMHKAFFIELEFDSDTIAEFTTVFGITSVQHMCAIQPALLMELYQQGKVVIFSAIDNPPGYYSLHFRKQHNTIWVKGENNIEQEVKEPLETATQFLAYTQQHYQLAGKS